MTPREKKLLVSTMQMLGKKTSPAKTDACRKNASLGGLARAEKYRKLREAREFAQPCIAKTRFPACRGNGNAKS